MSCGSWGVVIFSISWRLPNRQEITRKLANVLMYARLQGSQLFRNYMKRGETLQYSMPFAIYVKHYHSRDLHSSMGANLSSQSFLLITTASFASLHLKTKIATKIRFKSNFRAMTTSLETTFSINTLC